MARAHLPAAAAAAFLFFLNFFLCHELFGTDYTVHMGSIEGAYIALARYISSHWTDLDWFPLWYQGIPFQNAYPPLLHLLAAATTEIGLPPGQAYHAVSAFFYCLGPVMLFGLAYALSGRLGPSLGAGLLFSLLSPSAFLIEAVRNDVGGLFLARRYQALTQYGEGPHITAMTLLPLALWTLDRALERFTAGRVAAAAVAAAAVALANWLAAFALATAALALLVSRPDRGRAGVWLRAASCGAIAYAVAAPWIPPSTIAAVRYNAQHTVGRYPLELSSLKFVGLIALAAVLADRLLRRVGAGRALTFGVFWTMILGPLPLAAEWLELRIVPQPERYHLELEMALCIVGAFAAWMALSWLSAGERRWALAVALVFLLFQAPTYRRRLRGLSAGIAIEATAERRLAEAVAAAAPQRVWAEGSAGFWLNAFVDTPQLLGGFHQGITNRLLPVVEYGLMASPDAELTRMWLRALGVDAVAVGGRGSRLAVPSVEHPARFAEGGRTVWQDQELAVHVYPWGGAGAQVLRPSDLVQQTPLDFLDYGPLLPLLAAFDDPELPPATLTELAPDRLEIEAALEPYQLILVQQAYHPGWSAKVAGRQVPVFESRLGMLLVQPGCGGPCRVDLEYDGGVEMWTARALQATAVVGLIAWGWRERRRRS